MSGHANHWLEVADARLKDGRPADSLEVLGQLQQGNFVKSAPHQARLQALCQKARQDCIRALEQSSGFRLASSCTVNYEHDEPFVMGNVS